MYHIDFSKHSDTFPDKYSGPIFRAFDTQKEALGLASELADNAAAILEGQTPSISYRRDTGPASTSIRSNETEIASWEIVEADWPIHIESRNVDGLRVTHEFRTVQEMLGDWNSDDPAMGDNQILLVVKDGRVLYSSLGRKANAYEDTLRTSDLIDWFTSDPDSFLYRKIYMFSITRCHRRTCEHIGKVVGVVSARHQEEAEQKAWEMAGGDTSCQLRVWEATDEDSFFTVYKSEI